MIDKLIDKLKEHFKNEPMVKIVAEEKFSGTIVGRVRNKNYIDDCIQEIEADVKALKELYQYDGIYEYCVSSIVETHSKTGYPYISKGGKSIEKDFFKDKKLIHR